VIGLPTKLKWCGAAIFAAALLCVLGCHAATAAPIESLVVKDLTVGTGIPVHAGHFVIIHYDAWVYDDRQPEGKGHLFDSSRERGQTFTYVYGYKRAVPGMEKGMEAMRVGGRRLILVPARLGFDDLKYPYPRDVPVGAALVFELELLDVVPRGAPAPLNED
jgi:FKBP-type peptidyl-prolyl cis-trans isomerase FkpA